MSLIETPALLSDLFSSTGGWLSLAFVLGLVHAFDADHVMSLSVFATRGKGAREGVRAGLRWAVGHGLVVIAAGVFLIMLGRSLPAPVAVLAERGVGLVMIGLGATVWIDLARRRSHLHFHAHDDLPPHAHWHTHLEDGHGDGHGHAHSASMLGALHGLAGSAPILAVLPAAARSPLLGLGYLLLFAVGLALAMALVSGFIGHFAGRLSRRAKSSGLSVLRACCASGSIVLGAWLTIAG